MTTHVPFTDNFTDLSNTEGFQFEFRCERCGNGYRSAFRRDPRAAGQKLARGLGNLFGGALAEFTSAADRLLDRGTNSPAKDDALRAATAEIGPLFHQCRGCSDWVCGDVCWNDGVGQCARCSPIPTEELAQLQAEARRRQLQERLETTDLTAGIAVDQQARPRCASCGAQSSGGKFCGECGASLNPVRRCPGCAYENPPTSRFCAECGTGLVA
ncbi:zinc ribbon domain-containing protein [Microbacterium sp. Yaish 1]|uniref:zinc ribbon domain-containing protein n=1 Tax=Microbacterium sp. Yaish 1 TaxID=2025014 RepID=UPI000B93FD5B|nr:zinc ribbon domain-containing protein [Microbacterium sp. Yaish 1]OYC97138.1 zinc ribbon domain-containing protein [Microbacterium sp. Yaish 1]